MGVLKSLFTLGRAMITRVEESIEDTLGVHILDQHIQDAKAELGKAGESRVDLLARLKLSNGKIQDLRDRKSTLENRALEAMKKNVEAGLLNEVTEEIARLENDIFTEEQVLIKLEASRGGG